MAGPYSDDSYNFSYKFYTKPLQLYRVGEKSWTYKTTAHNLGTGEISVERIEVVWDGYKWAEIEPEPKEKAAPTNEYGPVEI